MTEKKQTGIPEASNVPAKTNNKLSTHAGFDPIVVKAQNYLDRLTSEAGFVFPKDYNPANALMAAKMHLMLMEDKKGNLVIDQCTPTSVLNSLIEMCQKGLNVIKKQCYFVKYDDKLKLSEDYRGKLMIAKRDADVKDCVGQCVYKGDVFEYIVDSATGRKQISKHEAKLDNQVAANILGAYAVVTYNDGSSKAEIMSLEQIRAAWGMGGAEGKSPAHIKFPDQMAIKTVMNRAVKVDAGSSDDSEIIPEEDAVTATRDRRVKADTAKKEATTDVDFEEVGRRAPYAEHPNSAGVITPGEDVRTNSTDVNDDMATLPSEDKPY